MSYCREGDDSNVYVIKSITGQYVCWSSSAHPRAEFVTTTPSGMLAHLRSHIESGDMVPERAMDRLRLDKRL
jgi:hypothetical protein